MTSDELSEILKRVSEHADATLRRARVLTEHPDDAAIPVTLLAIAEQLHLANMLEMARRAEEQGELDS